MLIVRTTRQILTAIVAALIATTALRGGALPDLRTFGLAGEIPETTGRVVLVDFWASWCAPCRASFPVLGDLHSRYFEKGLTVIGVGVDETERAHDRFVARMKPTFAILHDSQHRLAAELDLPAMPTTLLVDRTGKIRFRHAGFHGERTRAEWISQIETLLSEPNTDP